ncbi:MAG: TrkA C-terminal domain-containing protein [Euzebya sp.]
MFAAISLLLIALTSLIVTRVATVALTLTGLSRETARFQARSALSGAGFTTSESEAVMTHPVRRRIMMTLIFMGSVGLVTVMATLSATLIASKGLRQLSINGLVIFVGLLGIYFLASSRWFDKALTPVMTRVLRRYTDLEVRDYAALLQIAGDYAVMELLIEESDWLAGKSLQEVRLPDEGVLVLGIKRGDEHYVGAPEGDTVIHADETLVLYGTRQRLAELDRRDSTTGAVMHETATQEQERLAQEQALEDPANRDSSTED